MTCRRWTEYSNQDCEWLQTSGMSWYIWEQVCHPEGPKQVERVDQEEPYETQKTYTWMILLFYANVKYQTLAANVLKASSNICSCLPVTNFCNHKRYFNYFM